jgi:dienelactone hydrolase
MAGMNRCLVAVLALCGILPGQVPESTMRLLQYDRTQPLHLTQKSVETRPNAEVLQIEYDSPKGGRVTGFIVTPRRPGRFAGVVFGHWGEGNATEFLPEAIAYAEAGAVSVLVDYPWVRPYPHYRKLFAAGTTAEQDRDVQAQAIIDLRRAFDVLLARPDVDPRRVAYIGHSFGAQFGAVLVAVDRRMATAILIAGTPTTGAIFLESQAPEIAEIRAASGDQAMKHEVDVLSVLDGIRFVPRAAPISLLFQFARYERNFTEAHMKAYAAAASEPKSVLWYPTGHEVNDPQAFRDRAKWLEARIGLRGAARSF